MEDLPNSAGIYQIVNLITEHRYIGFSNNIKHRKNQHVCDLNKGIYRNKRGKQIMNIKTGEIYRSVSDLSELINIPKYELSRRLSGKRKNNTIYKYI